MLAAPTVDGDLHFARVPVDGEDGRRTVEKVHLNFLKPRGFISQVSRDAKSDKRITSPRRESVYFWVRNSRIAVFFNDCFAINVEAIQLFPNGLRKLFSTRTAATKWDLWNISELFRTQTKKREKRPSHFGIAASIAHCNVLKKQNKTKKINKKRLNNHVDRRSDFRTHLCSLSAS